MYMFIFSNKKKQTILLLQRNHIDVKLCGVCGYVAVVPYVHTVMHICLKSQNSTYWFSSVWDILRILPDYWVHFVYFIIWLGYIFIFWKYYFRVAHEIMNGFRKSINKE